MILSYICCNSDLILMNIFRKHRKIILILILPVLLFYISNSLINSHNHIIRGYLYSHSHPFDRHSDNRNVPFHSHTESELLLLDMLSNAEFIIVMILVFAGILTRKMIRLFPAEYEISLSPFLVLISPRGPPRFMLTTTYIAF